jgi:NarL family two-component system response regulator YdfI
VIRVAVAATSAVVRAGLEAVVRAGASLQVTDVMRSEEIEERMAEIAADVLLLELAELDEERAGFLAGASPPIVLLTNPADPALVRMSLRGSVRAVLSEDATAAEIVAAIRAAAAGLITVQPGILDLLAEDPRRRPAALDDPLSAREIEVLGMLAEGHTNKLIAQALTISEHTVKFHVTSIMSKLGAASRTEAVMQGIRLGLVMI